MKNQDKRKHRFSSENGILGAFCGAIRLGFEPIAASTEGKRTLRYDAGCRPLCTNGWSETGQQTASYSSMEHPLSANECSVVL